MSEPEGSLRELAAQLYALGSKHPRWSQAQVIVALCCDHLQLLGAFNERQQRDNERRAEFEEVIRTFQQKKC